MKIGVLGTGIVGRTIGTRLVGLGHQVTMGSRTPDNPAANRATAVAMQAITTQRRRRRRGEASESCNSMAFIISPIS